MIHHILFTVVIFFSFQLAALGQKELEVGSHIVIDKSTKLRSASFFAGTTYLKGSLSSGTICRILNLDLNKSSGVGVYIKVISGAKEGQTGWVYYHNAPASRTLSLHSADGKEVVLNSKAEVKDYFTETKDFLKNNIDGFVDATTVLPAKYKVVETEDELWGNVYKGRYIVKSVDPLDGIITIIKPVKNAQGLREDVELKLPYDFERLLKVPEGISDTFGSAPRDDKDCKEEGINHEYDGYKFQKGCDVLKKKDFTEDYDKLAICLASIKKLIREGGTTNKNVKKNLYKLNPLEQEFAAMTLTAYGEAGVLAPPLREMVMIMKTLENRVDYAREKGFKKVNALDAAIQSHQFSMWSNGFKNEKTGKFQYEQWYTAVKASEHNNSAVNSVKAFILYKKSKFKPTENIEKVYHYHTNYVSPDWKKSSKIVKPVVNGKGLKQSRTRHIFYRNIPWTFEYTKYKPKSQR